MSDAAAAGGCVNRVEEVFKQFFRGAVAQLPALASVLLASGKADGVCKNASGWPCRRPPPRRSSFATVDGEQPICLAMALYA